MKKLSFDYRMSLEFDNPVHGHHYSLKCIPSNSASQKIFSLNFEVNPLEDLNKTVDGFKNIIYVGHYLPEHTRFGFKVSGIAWVDNSHKKIEELNPLYKYQSVHTKPGKNIMEIYNNNLSEEDDFEKAEKLMHIVHNLIEYKAGATNIKTTAEEALELGMGVCQDYSHILLSLCRLYNIPARYVAGLMIGEGYTHAWVEIYYKGRWYGLDPTNDKLVDDYYIKLNNGRDYEDCIINRGSFYGNTNQTQKVYVSVKE